MGQDTPVGRPRRFPAETRHRRSRAIASQREATRAPAPPPRLRRQGAKTAPKTKVSSPGRSVGFELRTAAFSVDAALPLGQHHLDLARSKLQSSIFEALACCHSDTVTQITENRVGEVSFEFFRLEFFSERTARTKRIKTGHRSPAGGVSIGPSALDRRTGAVRSCVRSRCIAGSPRGALRRHHCRPARCAGFWHVSASAAGAAAGQHESRPAVPPAQGAAARAGSPIEPGRTGA